jgi:hypothetical protein
MRCRLWCCGGCSAVLMLHAKAKRTPLKKSRGGPSKNRLELVFSKKSRSPGGGGIGGYCLFRRGEV